MDLFNEIDDISDIFIFEKNPKLDSAVEEYEDLQSKYSSLHENYTKEIENSKKVEKCLVKCLKFYSKLCKKYEVQQKIISTLKETIKEKINCLEEAQKNEEKLKGLIEVYKTERTVYAGHTSTELRKEKELLLDICCKLLNESFRNNNTRSLSCLILRKFRKDLDDDKINFLKARSDKFKDKVELDVLKDLKSDFLGLKHEVNFKTETECKDEKIEEPLIELKDSVMKNDPLDLSMNKALKENKISNEQGLDLEHFKTTTEKNTEQVYIDSKLNFLEQLPSTIDSEKNCKEKETINICSESTLDHSRVRSVDVDVVSEENGSCLESTDLERNSSSPSPRNDPPPYETAVAEVQKKNVEKETDLPSVFDISASFPNVSKPQKELEITESTCLDFEVPVGGVTDCYEKAVDLLSMSKTEIPISDRVKSKEESAVTDETELFKIFREMTYVKLLSPLRECGESSMDKGICTYVSNGRETCDMTKDKNLGLGLKRCSDEEENFSRNKKSRLEEKVSNCGLLDSIMSAMSIQNEEFKSKGLMGGELENGAESNSTSCKFTNLGTKTYSRKRKTEKKVFGEDSAVIRENSAKSKDRQQDIERLVMNEIKNFVSSPISTKEDADKSVKLCVSNISNQPEEVIAKCIVAVVLENVDEIVEVFERPAPPLTKTQHRLFVLLTVFRTLDSNSDKITAVILSLLWEKLFPDNFFWPDDSVEAATRFYAALCRAKNDTKTLWKFCLQAMTDMKQRCPLLMFTVLKTWPDVLHDASTLKNNILAVTIVNIFLHMPKTEGLRNFNQARKLVALKHLLMNFYQFKVEDTIESFAGKVLEAVFKKELASEKSVVLLSKCRDVGWTVKHVVPTLKSALSDWFEGKVEDSVASRVLFVLKQIFPILTQGKEGPGAKIKEVVSCLSEILTSGKKEHTLQVEIVEVLLQSKGYAEARKVIREWIPKYPIDDSLRNDIINASAENILRELKLNKRKEVKIFGLKSKLKKHSKKSKGKSKGKGKKKKGNKRKKSEQKS